MVSENGGVDVAKLRALLSDHAPQTYMQRDQMKVADVWAALPELLRVYEAWEALHRDCDAHPCKWPCLRDDVYDWLHANGVKV